MKKYILIVSVLFMFAPSLHSQWIQQNWPEFESEFGTCFFDINTGFVAGKLFPSSLYKLFKTTDGGFNWSVNYSTRGWIHSIQKLDDSTLYMLGDNSVSALLYKTTNRGISWDSINYTSLDGMYFISRDTGWVSMFDGNYMRYYFTSNGGINFTLLNSQLSDGYEPEMFFLKEKYNDNYVGFHSIYHAVKKTTDGGYNWIDLPELPIVPQYDKNGKLLTPPDVTQITFINKDTGWVANSSKSIFKTTNGGLNWIPQPIPSDSHLIFTGLCNFVIANKDTLFSDIGTYDFGNNIYKGVVYKTTNGGVNWGYQLPDTSYRLFNFSKPSFLNGNTGWFTNIHTTNGGGPIIYTEIKNIVAEHPEEYQLMQNYPNPFNPSTTIDFYLPHKASIELKVFDISGKTVLRIIDNFQLQQGYHSYKVDDFNSLGLSSGMYFYRLTASDNSSKTSFTETKRLVYLK